MICSKVTWLPVRKLLRALSDLDRLSPPLPMFTGGLAAFYATILASSCPFQCCLSVHDLCLYCDFPVCMLPFFFGVVWPLWLSHNCSCFGSLQLWVRSQLTSVLFI